MKKKPVDAIQGYRQFMHTHTYRTSEKFPIIWKPKVAVPRCKIVPQVPRIAHKATSINKC